MSIEASSKLCFVLHFTNNLQQIQRNRSRYNALFRFIDDSSIGIETGLFTIIIAIIGPSAAVFVDQFRQPYSQKPL